MLFDTGYGMVGFIGIRGKGEDWNVSKNDGQGIRNLSEESIKKLLMKA